MDLSCRALKETKKLMACGNPCLFNYYAEIMTLSSSIALNGTALPRMTFNGDTMVYKGREIELAMIGDCIRRLLEEAEMLIKDKIFMGADPTDVLPDFSKLFDDVSNCQAKYSIFMEDSNPFLAHRDALIEHLFLDPACSRRFVSIVEGKPVFNLVAVKKLFANTKRLQDCLLPAKHLSGGMPPRGQEEASEKQSNTLVRTRNLHMLFDFICMVGKYNKTTNNTTKDKIILRTFPQALSKLIVLYIGFIRPLELFLLHLMVPLESYSAIHDLYSTHMWVTPKGLYNTDQLSHLLKIELSKELGHGYGIADTRHILIGFYRQRINSEAERTNLEFAHILEMIGDQQAGHTPEVAQAHYAVNSDFISEVPESVLKQQLVVSQFSRSINNPQPEALSIIRAASYGTTHLDSPKNQFLSGWWKLGNETSRRHCH